MRFTSEQLLNHPKYLELTGAKSHAKPPVSVPLPEASPQEVRETSTVQAKSRKKATDEELEKSYRETGSVWKTAKLFGMCGQSVHERLSKRGLTENNHFTDAQKTLVRDFYSKEFKKSELKEFCNANSMLVTSVCRWARENGLKTSLKRSATEAMRAAQATLAKKHIEKNGHPRGMLGKKHSEESLELISKASVTANKRRTREEKQAIALKKVQTRYKNGVLLFHRPHVTWKQAWHTIGGKRNFYRSSWEAKYGHFLEFLKRAGELQEWVHEPDIFWFEGVKKGTTNYTPDFKVTLKDGSIEYHEVKGWMDAKSKTKLRRMKIYHPNVKVVLRGADWFKRNRQFLGKIVMSPEV